MIVLKIYLEALVTMSLIIHLTGEIIIRKHHNPIVLRPPSGQDFVVIGSSVEMDRNAKPKLMSTPNPKDLLGPWEDDLPLSDTNAVFTTQNNTEVTVQEGSTAALRCQIVNVADRETVSWIRRRDHHLITIGSVTYSSDDRFQVTVDEKLNDWTLHIHYTQARDAGIYECQISTHPPISVQTTLNVVAAKATITGGPEMHVQVGSEVHLQCNIEKFTEPPTYVFWYHNDRMINYDSHKRFQILYDGEGTSELRIDSALSKDSGNYTCHPSNAQPASVGIHILADEKPAAVQRASASNFSHEETLALVSCILFTLSLDRNYLTNR